MQVKRPPISSLRRVPLFSALPDSSLEGLQGIFVRHAATAGDWLFWEDDPPQRLFVIESGRVRISKGSRSGKEFVVAFLGEGDVVGEVAVLQGKPYPASASAASDATLLVASGSDFMRLLEANPTVAASMLAILSERLREAQLRLADMASERVEQRVARLVHRLSSRLGPSLPFTRQDLGEMVGITTETSIRVLGAMRDRGIIGGERGEIVVLDAKRLELLGQGPPAPK